MLPYGAAFCLRVTDLVTLLQNDGLEYLKMRLKKQKNQKSSRVVRKIREHVIFITKEVQLGIGNKRCTKEPLINCEKKHFDKGLTYVSRILE